MSTNPRDIADEQSAQKILNMKELFSASMHMAGSGNIESWAKQDKENINIKKVKEFSRKLVPLLRAVNVEAPENPLLTAKFSKGELNIQQKEDWKKYEKSKAEYDKKMKLFNEYKDAVASLLVHKNKNKLLNFLRENTEISKFLEKNLDSLKPAALSFEKYYLDERAQLRESAESQSQKNIRKAKQKNLGPIVSDKQQPNKGQLKSRKAIEAQKKVAQDKLAAARMKIGVVSPSIAASPQITPVAAAPITPQPLALSDFIKKNGNPIDILRIDIEALKSSKPAAIKGVLEKAIGERALDTLKPPKGVTMLAYYNERQVMLEQAVKYLSDDALMRQEIIKLKLEADTLKLAEDIRIKLAYSTDIERSNTSKQARIEERPKQLFEKSAKDVVTSFAERQATQPSSQAKVDVLRSSRLPSELKKIKEDIYAYEFQRARSYFSSKHINSLASIVINTNMEKLKSALSDQDLLEIKTKAYDEALRGFLIEFFKENPPGTKPKIPVTHRSSFLESKQTNQEPIISDMQQPKPLALLALLQARRSELSDFIKKNGNPIDILRIDIEALKSSKPAAIPDILTNARNVRAGDAIKFSIKDRPVNRLDDIKKRELMLEHAVQYLSDDALRQEIIKLKLKADTLKLAEDTRIKLAYSTDIGRSNTSKQARIEERSFAERQATQPSSQAKVDVLSSSPSPSELKDIKEKIYNDELRRAKKYFSSNYINNIHGLASIEIKTDMEKLKSALSDKDLLDIKTDAYDEARRGFLIENPGARTKIPVTHRSSFLDISRIFPKEHNDSPTKNKLR